METGLNTPTGDGEYGVGQYGAVAVFSGTLKHPGIVRINIVDDESIALR